MKVRALVTAGSTEIDIDSVRQVRTIDPDYDLAIGNSFKGATGANIARYLREIGHDVTLVTSDRDFFLRDDNLTCHNSLLPTRVNFFRTYSELASLMEAEVRWGRYDVIVHSAAVSDFFVDGVYVLENGTLVLIDNSSKISSSHQSVFPKMVPTEKLIDKIRSLWNFDGKLVKFKLQTKITDEELIKIANKSRDDSRADIIVANCREWYRERAYIIGADGSCQNVTRDRLAEELGRRLL